MANASLPIYSDQIPRLVSSNGLSIREDVFFTGAKGRQTDSSRRKAEALLEKWKDVLPPLLEPNETIFYIVKNCQAPVTPLPPPNQNTFVTYKAALASGYTSGYQADVNGNPGATASIVSSGPYQGLTALITPYWIDVVGKTPTGGEVHLQRQMETVAIPVFQFGIFSDTDLSFFAGPDFNHQLW